MAQRVCEDCGIPSDWSVDGRKVFYFERPRTGSRVMALDVASGEKVELLKSEHNLGNGRLSTDGGWILFNESLGTMGGRLWIAPHRGPAPVAQREWMLVSESPGSRQQGCWAPDGNLVYLISEGDGFRCIWAQRVDSSTKRPRGAPFPVRHFHAALSMMPMADVKEIVLNAARDRLVFSLVESIGDIWLAKLGTPR